MRELRISSAKKRFSDKHGIKNEDGTYEFKTIMGWIQNDPVRLWNDIYSAGGSKRCSLVPTCLESLTEKIKKVAPELHQKLVERKKLQKLNP